MFPGALLPYFVAVMCCMVCGTTASAQTYRILPVGERFTLMKDSVRVTDSLYTEMSEVVDGYLWVNKGDLYGYIDTTGRAITPFIYDEVSSFRDGRARVARDSMYGYINHKGEEVIAVQYKEVTLFRLGLASVRTDSNWLVIDTAGSALSSHGFDFPAAYTSVDFICVAQNGRWGVINARGEIIHPFLYDLVCPDGRAWLNDKMIQLGGGK